MDNIVNLYIVSQCIIKHKYSSILQIIYPSNNQYHTILHGENTNCIENELKILCTGIKQFSKNNIENNYGYSNFYVKIHLDSIDIKSDMEFDIPKDQSNYLLFIGINAMLSKFTKVDFFNIDRSSSIYKHLKNTILNDIKYS